MITKKTKIWICIRCKHRMTSDSMPARCLSCGSKNMMMYDYITNKSMSGE